MSNRIDLKIIEYKNGNPQHLYYGLSECAEAMHCHMELIKALIYTGNPFPYLDDTITFDIAPDCPYHIERTHVNPTQTRYYSFAIVKDHDDSQRPIEAERRIP